MHTNRQRNRMTKRTTTKTSKKASAKKFDLTREQVLDLLRQMCEIRLFEETVYDLLGKNLIKGASHLYAGGEAVALGAISTLRDDDLITSTHRHCHARGASLAAWSKATVSPRRSRSRWKPTPPNLSRCASGSRRVWRANWVSASATMTRSSNGSPGV